MKILVLFLLFPLLLAGQTIQMNQGAQTSQGRAGGGVTSVNGQTGPAINITGTGAAAVTTPAPNTININVPVGGLGGITHDASEFGVKADGILLNCGVALGSKNVHCDYNGFVSADVGKLVILYGAGPSTGNLDPSQYLAPMTVVGGGTSGKPGWRPITFTDTDDGCNTIDSMPYGSVWVGNDGKPTGKVWFPVFQGDGCTKVPTSGTVATVTGKVTFTGGQLRAGDLVTKIDAVSGPADLTLHDAAVAAAPSGVLLYGTDDHDAWETACNTVQIGHLTFGGNSLVSRGVDCSNARFFLEGKGYGMLGRAPNGSLMIYAGKTRGDHILRLHGGWAPRVERMGFRGNSVAQPVAVLLSIARPDLGLFGWGINQNAVFNEVWFGWQWGEHPQTVNGYQLTSCILADAYDYGYGGGNIDFANIDRSYCFGAEVGFNGSHNQSGAWVFNRIHIQGNNIGTAVWSGQLWKELYTEFNRLDVMVGSPNYAGAYAQGVTFEVWGGEASSKALEFSKLHFPAPYVTVNAGGLGLPYADDNGHVFTDDNAWINPTGIWVDTNRGVPHSFTWNGPLLNQGKMTLRNVCGGGSQITLGGGIRPEQILWDENYTYVPPACANLAGGSIKMTAPGMDIDMAMPTYIPGGQMKLPSYQKEDYFRSITGALRVTSATPPGKSAISDTQYLEIHRKGAAGSTPYRYQVSCTDGGGFETQASPVLTIADGVPSLSDVNAITVLFWPHKGCVEYNLYSDRGSGEIGYLFSMGQNEIPSSYPLSSCDPGGVGCYSNSYMTDTGASPKNMSRTPLVTSNSGAIDANLFKKNGELLASKHLADFAQTTPLNGQVPVFNAGLGKYVPENVSTDGGITPPGGIEIPQSEGVLLVKGQGGGATQDHQVGHSTIGSGDAASGTNILFLAFTPAANSTVIDCNFYFRAAPTRAYCFLYDSDGANIAGSPGTLLCNDITGTVPAPNSWTKISSLQVSSCPPLIANHKYYVTILASGSPTMAYDSGFPNETSFYSPEGLCCTAPPSTAGMAMTPLQNAYSMFMTIRSGGPSGYSLTTTLGTGYLHYNGTDYSWETGTGGPGGGGDVSAATPAPSQYQTAVWESPTTIKGIGPGTAGQVFTSNGASADPSWQAAGGPPALSDLTNATANKILLNGNFTQEWYWALTTNGKYGLRLGESALSTGTGTTLLGVTTSPNSSASPFSAMTATAGNGIKVEPVTGNLAMQGTAKLVGPVQLPAIQNAAALGTDQDGNIMEKTGGAGPGGGGETPIYNNTFDLSVSGGLTALSGLGCSGNTCTLATPTSNGTYSVKFLLTQITPGSGGTCNAGSVQLRLSYKNSDNGEATAAARILVGRAANSAGYILAFPVNGAANSQTNEFIYAPFEFRAAGGTPITLQVNITPASNCDTPAVARLRLALFGPLPY